MSVQGFWRDQKPTNQRLVIGGLGAINNVWYIAPQGQVGLGIPRQQVFSSFTDLKPNLRSRDVINIVGVLREQAVAPDGVYDVLIQGAANTPRQATDSGTPTGGGATWMAPTSPTALTPLLEIIRQGWAIQNLLFNPTTSSAAVRLTTSGGLNEAGQFSMSNCTILGGGTGQIGIEDNGGSGFCVIEECLFQLLTGTALLGLTTANAVPLSWAIKRNTFKQNTNDIKMSLSYASIEKNRHHTAGSGSTNKVVSTIALSGQGGFNQVILNFFNNTTGEIQISNGYSGASTDLWSNYCKGTAALIVTSPPGA